MATGWDDYGDWPRTLLDTIYRLPSSYAPSDLVSTANAGINGGDSVRGFVIPDLAEMANAARDAGAAFGVASGYRSYWTQVSTFNSWVNDTGYEDALLVSARPGHSEHQLGTTLDLKPAGGPDPWEIDFGNTAAGSWLRANAWRYGFVMSYPYGPSPALTCYAYEPWHFRYFGREITAAIHESGETSREYLWGHGSAMSSPTPATVVASPRPRRVIAGAGGDRPPKKAASPVVQVAGPDPSIEPTPETQLPDLTIELTWPAWFVDRSWLDRWRAMDDAARAAKPPAPNALVPYGEGPESVVDAAAEGRRTQPVASILLGQFGVVAGLVFVLAIDSRVPRRRPN